MCENIWWVFLGLIFVEDIFFCKHQLSISNANLNKKLIHLLQKKEIICDPYSQQSIKLKTKTQSVKKRYQ